MKFYETIICSDSRLQRRWWKFMLGCAEHIAELSQACATATTTVLWLACQKVSTMATVQHSSAYACVPIPAAVLR